MLEEMHLRCADFYSVRISAEQRYRAQSHTAAVAVGPSRIHPLLEQEAKGAFLRGDRRQFRIVVHRQDDDFAVDAFGSEPR